MSQQDPAAGEELPPPGAPSRSSSASRLNAQAPEFVPRPPAPVQQQPAVIRVFAGPPPPPPASFFVAGPPPPLAPPPFEYYAAVGAGGGGAGFGAVPAEHELGPEQPVVPPQVQPQQQQGRELASDDALHKITKQV